MQTIKFRFRDHNGDWLTGSVDGRLCTGTKDKNGIYIYEGDIIRAKYWMGLHEFIVLYGDGSYDSDVYEYRGFYCVHRKSNDSDGYGHILLLESKYLEVVGNIYNPEEETP